MPAELGRNSKNLHLVMLALELTSRNEPDMPDSLQSYLSRIVHEAAELATDPHKLSPASSPEAISLALQIIDNSDLMENIDSLAGSTRITPELASIFLRRMDRLDASAR